MSNNMHKDYLTERNTELEKRIQDYGHRVNYSKGALREFSQLSRMDFLFKYKRLILILKDLVKILDGKRKEL